MQQHNPALLLLLPLIAHLAPSTYRSVCTPGFDNTAKRNAPCVGDLRTWWGMIFASVNTLFFYWKRQGKKGGEGAEKRTSERGREVERGRERDQRVGRGGGRGSKLPPPSQCSLSFAKGNKTEFVCVCTRKSEKNDSLSPSGRACVCVCVCVEGNGTTQQLDLGLAGEHVQELCFADISKRLRLLLQPSALH